MVQVFQFDNITREEWHAIRNAVLCFFSWHTFVFAIYLSMVTGPRPYSPIRRISKILNDIRERLLHFAQKTQDLLEGRWWPGQVHCERCRKLTPEEVRLEMEAERIWESPFYLRNPPQYSVFKNL
ncbi:hypothetical protein Dda_2405 [Drechslerella dactyloides]|uniref:Uncharacterized protein n=1 Tax=Drechslerella dactyloides TaxID=74499 RepID=A0AAD6J3I4_DREDA|nr:hypothetical protein Dda_2405 [Drechslerella dactyloides]